MDLNFRKLDGLMPAIIQEVTTGEVLMLGFMSPEALKLTLDKGYVHFWSRTRQEIWKKGETSGDYLEVRSIYIDCDKDTLLVKVKLAGQAVCHTGKKSCFYRQLDEIK